MLLVRVDDFGCIVETDFVELIDACLRVDVDNDSTKVKHYIVILRNHILLRIRGRFYIVPRIVNGFGFSTASFCAL